MDLVDTQRLIRDTSIRTKEDLDNFLRVFFDVYLAKIPLIEGNSSPLDFVWDIYSTCIHKDRKDKHYNVLATAARGSQKCVRKNTRIFTNKGSFKIGDDISPKYVDSYPKKREVVEIQNNGKAKIWRLVTDYGYEFEGTDNHRIAIYDKGIKYKELKDLKHGNYLILGGNALFNEDDDSTFINGYDIGISNKHKDYIPKFIWTSNKACICGYLLGMFEKFGEVQEVNSIITFNLNDIQHAKDLQMLLSVFGIKSYRVGNKLASNKENLIKFNAKICENGLNSKSKYKDDDNFFYDKVSLVEDTKEIDEVYDLSTPDNACFIANGILVHNTLSTAVLESLLLLHDENRDMFHMASIYDQSYIAYKYVKDFFKEPLLREKLADVPKKGHTENIFGRVLQIGTGSMDSVNSFHGCIAGSQRVGVKSGFLKLDDIFLANRKPCKIESDRELRNVVSWKDSGKQKCVRITLESGRELLLTPNHSLQVFNGDFVFKRVDDISKGDTLLVRHTGKWPGANSPNNRFKSIIPQNLNDFYYLVGRAIGDACLTVDGRIEYSTKDKSDAILISNLFKKTYPHSNPRLARGKSDNCYSVIIQNKKIKKEWVKLGIHEVSAKDKVIPEFIFYSSKKLFYEFLSGYWDADGAIRVTVGDFGNSLEMSFCSISKYLLLDIQSLLTRDGIYSKVRHSRIEYYLDIYAGNVKSLVTNMNTRLSFGKSDCFNRIDRDSLYLSGHNPKWDKDLIRPLFKDLMTYRHSLVKSRFVEPKEYSYCIENAKKNYENHVIERILSETIHCADHKSWKILHKIISTPIWSDKVVKIEDAGVHNTYDVQVEDVPIWCPNNILAHNSVISDEVDLMDRAVFRESKGMLSAFRGHLPINVSISSRKFAHGNIQAMIDKIKSGRSNTYWHRWGVLEITQRCSDKRSGTKKVPIYVDDNHLVALSKNQYKELPKDDKVDYVENIGYENCVKCGIFGFCKGNLKKQVTDNPFLQPIELTKSQFREDSVEFFKSQRLNMKPSTIGLVYPQWSDDIHRKNHNELWEIITGEILPQGVKKDKSDLVRLLHNTEASICIALDFGFTNAHALLLAFDKKDRVFVLDEIVVQTKTDLEFILTIKEIWGDIELETCYPDIADPGAIKTLKNILKTHVTYKVIKDKDEGYNVVRNFLRIPGTNESRLWVAADCVTLSEQMALLHRKIDKKSDEPTDKVEKKNDHGTDALRYALATRYAKNKPSLTPNKSSRLVSSRYNFNPKAPVFAPSAKDLANYVKNDKFQDNRNEEKARKGKKKRKIYF